MKILFEISVLLLSFILVEKVSAIDFRIVGGSKAPEEYGKFHASIQNLTRHHVCGGAVVSKFYVVTAAHCVHRAKAPHMKIIAGTNDLEAGGKEYKVESIIVYDDYNSTSKEHDIALLQTKRPFDLRYIQILKLSTYRLFEGDRVILVGFGAKEPNGQSTSKMYALELPVFSQPICEFAMRYSTPVTKDMFCTFTQIGQGTCHGDSGSPIIKGNELVGVVSWGIPCAVGFPDVHTRISSYVGWIQKHIERSYCIPPRRNGLK
ncbi:chymotrypsin-2-like [Helicoverpa zea]|uniref:chymotrypsin-2-like n=1 Tax=Helicoverpa zea TaxID=7113 RepID=UPI001F58622D|nr:chymotrypsin-2-like [Helicoverpa zea]